MNIVYQRLPLAPDDRFDLIIGTNIFVYYGTFEQSLARANVSAMLKPGGHLLSNDKLPDTVPSGLDQEMVTDIPMTPPPVITDYIYCYRRTP
jgi:predicted TPR repeat methyltransferase